MSLFDTSEQHPIFLYFPVGLVLPWWNVHLTLAPSIVVNFTIQPESEEGIQLFWGPPLKPNGKLSLYFIQLLKPDGDIVRFNTSELQLVVSNLTAFTNYTVNVSRYLLEINICIKFVFVMSHLLFYRSEHRQEIMSFLVLQLKKWLERWKEVSQLINYK